MLVGDEIPNKEKCKRYNKFELSKLLTYFFLAQSVEQVTQIINIWVSFNS